MYTLLLIDDEKFTLKYLETIIDWEKYGFTLLKAMSDSEAAVEYIKNNRPNLIITDINMPVISGIDIAEYCYNNIPETNIVFITGYREFEYAQQAVKFGVSEYIVKPFLPADLINVLNKIREKCDKAENKLDFCSDDSEFKAQRLFSNLICGIIKDEETLKNEYSGAGFDSKAIENPCVIFNMSIKNYEEYMSNVWKHGTGRLFHAIASIIFRLADNIYFSLIMYSYGNIEIIGYSGEHIKNEDYRSAISEICSAIKENLRIEAEIGNIRFYEKISKLINSDSELDADKFVHSNAVISEAYKFIRENYSKPVSTRDVAEYVHLSNAYFTIFYRKHTNETFVETLNKYRVEKAKEFLMKDDNLKTSMIYSDFGFSNQGHFYKVFKHYTNMTPKKFKEKIF